LQLFLLISDPRPLLLIIYSPANPAIMSSKSQLTYTVRAESHPNPLARRLFQVAEAKKSNVTVSADVTTTKELLDLADRTLSQESPSNVQTNTPHLQAWAPTLP
jgi:hypothetical protein